MKFDIYCDESRPDLFTSKSAIGDKYLLIGGLWLPTEKRDEVKRGINALKERFGVRGEIKWKKVSPAHLDFYVALVDLFIDFGLDLRFRCIAVEAAKVDMVHYHESDSELGFYKFYYQLIRQRTSSQARDPSVSTGLNMRYRTRHPSYTRVGIINEGSMTKLAALSWYKGIMSSWCDCARPRKLLQLDVS